MFVEDLLRALLYVFGISHKLFWKSEKCDNFESVSLSFFSMRSNHQSQLAYLRKKTVSVVEKLPERMGTAFPLLKCLRKLWALNCMILNYKMSKFFPGVIARTPAAGRVALPLPRQHFRLARHRSHCSSFTKRPLNHNVRLPCSDDYSKTIVFECSERA